MENNKMGENKKRTRRNMVIIKNDLDVYVFQHTLICLNLY